MSDHDNVPGLLLARAVTPNGAVTIHAGEFHVLGSIRRRRKVYAIRWGVDASGLARGFHWRPGSATRLEAMCEFWEIVNHERSYTVASEE